MEEKLLEEEGERVEGGSDAPDERSETASKRNRVEAKYTTK